MSCQRQLNVIVHEVQYQPLKVQAHTACIRAAVAPTFWVNIPGAVEHAPMYVVYDRRCS